MTERRWHRGHLNYLLRLANSLRKIRKARQLLTESVRMELRPVEAQWEEIQEVLSGWENAIEDKYGEVLSSIGDQLGDKQC